MTQKNCNSCGYSKKGWHKFGVCTKCGTFNTLAYAEDFVKAVNQEAPLPKSR
jgi:predicted ATP-dependent serine protease